jgi:hypothetical protein
LSNPEIQQEIKKELVILLKAIFTILFIMNCLILKFSKK